MCRLIFETVKWENGAPCLLPWHQRRVESSMKRCGMKGAPVPELAAVLESWPGPEGVGLYKCHITYDTRGRVRKPVFEPYRPRMVRVLVGVEVPSSFDYSCKWEDRAALMAAGAGLGDGEEALILRDGFVTDTRYSSVVFGDGCSWITPDTYLLPGTKRAFLLEQGMIEARPLRGWEVKEFHFCSLINAMLDLGDVVVRTEDIVLP